ncbi:hypothetical protein M2347_000193 [Chryseobacterium sp. H1D6B]|uniref:DUF6705 family protein n=1 Tax=Chryseobacterium sp. H1D6B TaxID=2940588 RepID=UPI0015CE043B|nr:DUF6705 family protein [Chryseobacterium sp. H1D6B]MDH6250466.1 hypothetical protein [Chryseobacterium sp. H1D6B]
MKNIFKFLLITIGMLLNHNCQAQNNPPQDGDNILNNNLDKFVGTWKWEENGKSLEIILKKENVKIPVNMNLHGDVLYGYHEYKINGSIIESSKSYINSNFYDKKHSLFTMGSQDSPDQLKLGITHLSKNKAVNSIIQYIDANHIKLVKVENYAGTKVSFEGQPPYDSSISLPQNIILTKQ